MNRFHQVSCLQTGNISKQIFVRSFHNIWQTSFICHNRQMHFIFILSLFFHHRVGVRVFLLLYLTGNRWNCSSPLTHSFQIFNSFPPYLPVSLHILKPSSFSFLDFFPVGLFFMHLIIPFMKSFRITTTPALHSHFCKFLLSLVSLCNLSWVSLAWLQAL